MQQLGGFSLYLKPGEIHLGVKESIYDTAKVLSRYHDVIMIRWNNFKELKEFARYADVPVINAMTDVNHPCQALADIYTITRSFPDGPEDPGIVVVLRAEGDMNTQLNELLMKPACHLLKRR